MCFHKKKCCQTETHWHISAKNCHETRSQNPTYQLSGLVRAPPSMGLKYGQVKRKILKMGPSVFLLDEKALLQTQAPFATIKTKQL